MSVQTIDTTKNSNTKLKELVIPVTGMHCANCANTVARNLKRLSGVSDASVSYASERATVSYDPAQVQPTQMLDKLGEIGYGAAVAEVDLPISGTTGNAGGNPPVNAATLENRGFELAVTYRSTAKKDFKWDATLNFTTIRNEVIAFGNETTKYTQLGDARTQLGRAIGEWYVLKTDGIFQNQGEIDAHKGKTGEVLQPWSQPGDIRYLDVDDDGVLDLDKDRYYAGSPWANWEAGFILNATYKNFGFNMQWYAVVGNKLYNRPRYNVDRMDQNTNFRKEAQIWTAQNQSTEWPRAAIGAPDRGIQYNVLPQSDRWLESGSYLRLRNIEISYTLSQSSLKRVGFKECRFYVSGQNLLTITKYTGLDPDIVGVNIFERGLDNGQYPALRIVSAGVRFGL